MTTKNFRVSFLIPQVKLSTIMQVLTKEVSDLNITSEDGRPNHTMKTPATRKVAPRGSAMYDLVTQWIINMPKGQEFKVDEVKAVLKKAGHKDSNSSPILSKIMAGSNIAVSPGKGLYRRT